MDNDLVLCIIQDDEGRFINRYGNSSDIEEASLFTKENAEKFLENSVKDIDAKDFDSKLEYKYYINYFKKCKIINLKMEIN